MITLIIPPLVVLIPINSQERFELAQFCNLLPDHRVEFKDKQVTDIDSKMQELNKSMEFEINFCFKEYIFDSLAQVLNQIKIRT